MNATLNYINNLINSGEYSNALIELHQLMADFPPDKGILNSNYGGFLIDIGSYSNNEELVKKGISLFEEVGKNSDMRKTADYYYNLANGYMNIFSLSIREKINHNNFYPFQEYPILEKAKLNFEHALIIDKTRADLRTNYGNLLSKLGRPFEALIEYEKALKIDNTFGMAVGNIGVALHQLAKIAGSDQLEIYRLAYNYINKGLSEKDSIYRFGGHHAYLTFQTISNTIELLFSANPELLLRKTQHKKYSKKLMSRFKKFYIKFSVQNNLFLNFHIDNKDCISAIEDSLFISIYTDIKDDKTFYRLAKKINDIKEAYMSARLILVQSKFKNKDLNSLSKLTLLVYPEDHSINNIYVGLLKNAYKECFNILDKIAYFLDDYLNLQITSNNRDISYKNFWFKDQNYKKGIHSNITNNRNYLLYGIYSSMMDIYKNKVYEETRHKLTHLNLYLHNIEVDSNSNNSISVEDFEKLTLDLFQNIKNTIIYLCNFVNSDQESTHKPSSKFLTMNVSHHQSL